MIVKFTVPGAVVGKGRPRFAKRGAFVSTYTPEKTANYENLVKLAAHRAMDWQEPYAIAVRCTIDVSVMPALSWSKKKRIEALSGVSRPTSKPDLDNVAKGILDAMNGVVFKDDCQVVELVLRKRYAETAQAVVEVAEA